MIKNSTTSEEIRQIWAKSGYTYNELSVITGISENTLASWITTNEKRQKNPPPYIVDYVRMKVDLSKVKNNADVIRRLSDKELAEFIIDILEKGIEGTAYDFVKGTNLLRKYKV